MKRVFTSLLAVFLATTTLGAARGDVLLFSFADPAGDQTAAVDLIAMNFVFNNTTGAYSIGLTSSAAKPFLGSFRLNINLYNRDAGTTENPAFFSSVFNDFNYATPATLVTLTGTNTRLTSWEAGDRVAVSNAPFGNPTGPSGISAFWSGVWTGTSLTSSDDFGFSNTHSIITSAAVPESSPLALAGVAGIGAMALAGWRSRRRAR